MLVVFPRPEVLSTVPTRRGNARDGIATGQWRTRKVPAGLGLTYLHYVSRGAPAYALWPKSRPAFVSFWV